MTPNTPRGRQLGFANLLICKGLFGGPDRDRTDDLFHAMECFKSQIIDGTGLMSRYSRQNRHNRRYLLPKCCQICNQWATGLIVWDRPKFLDWASEELCSGLLHKCLCWRQPCANSPLRFFGIQSPQEGIAGPHNALPADVLHGSVSWLCCTHCVKPSLFHHL